MSPKRALIFANGQLPDLSAAAALIQPDDLLIAADGGAHTLLALGKTPHAIIGDLDSLLPREASSLQQAGALILRYPPEKDETDLELALQYALQQGCTTIRVVGGLGGRIDQTLANIFLLASPALSATDIRLDDGREEVFLIRSAAILHGSGGDTVSLLPLGSPARGVTTGGLRYPLKDENLWPDRSRGVSNEMTEDEAFVRLSEGILICIHTRKAGNL
ncbi:MAG TPA: thiamine diphosphokinase [Anaerolinea thermolimosa]|uniref:Thiamine diphosphokinase n=1 Tax=Anaerolinea thermolimosa TaxID=229919 RepID=A0A3D1JF90_9CHLR|nr:thiamine diphosphokinase [Anaerolinea thermolimosa]GAP07346.1 thiamine diphosphokinase [Anaerolinea thermolimosa]HCE16907.1 thiamine diphosphokinase [Anaerolinea thermolimosa]